MPGSSTNPGASQTTPLVHDGVMYLANPGNVIDALDAQNGQLLWEYRRPMDERRRPSAQTRSLAIVHDVVVLAAADAHLVGLDARTGVSAGTPTSAARTIPDSRSPAGRLLPTAPSWVA